MKRFFYILFLLSSLTVSAQNYTVETVDAKRVMVGSSSFKGLSDEAIYSNLLFWIYNNEAGTVKEKDFGHSLVLSQKISTVQDPNTYYTTNISFKIEHGNLMFIAKDIVRNGKSGFTYSAKPFERLNPEKKPKDKQIVSEFENFENQIITSLISFISTNKLPKISYVHINDIKQERVVEGMTETECILAVGKPKVKTETNNGLQWLMSFGTYIFFKNGKVSAVVK